MKIKINFMEKKKNVIEFDFNNETPIENLVAEPNNKIVPLILLNVDNIYQVGYVPEFKRMILHLKSNMKMDFGMTEDMRPEPFIYIFHDVPYDTYKSFLNDTYKADYFNKNIKDNYMYHREQVFMDF